MRISGNSARRDAGRRFANFQRQRVSAVHWSLKLWVPGAGLEGFRADTPRPND